MGPVTEGATGSGGGAIVLAATPIGDPGDASPRLIRLLQTADVVAAEDTRRLRRLASALGIAVRGSVVSYYDANEQVRSAELVEQALRGATIAVVTDAGMPSVSDPGYRIVAEAVAKGVHVTAIPGPSAVSTALSGLPSDRFCFEGFLPRKAGERATRIAQLAAEQRTMVFFEAPHRLAAMLAALADGLGPQRPAAVCRELTKTYEQVVRGPIADLVQWAQGEVLGEITVVVQGATAQERRVAAGVADAADWVEQVRVREAQGVDRKAAIAEVAKAAGVPRREVYDAVVRVKSDRA